MNAEPCPDCADDPSDDSLHAIGCRRIMPAGDPLEHLQFGPPWISFPTDGAA